MRIGILLSGGIDSMMAARLLQEEGHEVTAVTMITHENFDLLPAQKAASWLNIELKTIHVEELFQKYVIDYFCSTYEKGETPNPCVMCNQYVKLGALLEKALSLNFEKIATGHYASIRYHESENFYTLHKGKDPRKDQSYFLYRLNQEKLSCLTFPLGNLRKDEVRKMAEDRHFPSFVTLLRESQDICFLPSDYRDFIRPRVPENPGHFMDENGKILGDHRGIAWYTVGQRKGLGISAPYPLYVLRLNAATQEIILGKNEKLFSSDFFLQNCIWLTPEQTFPKNTVQVKVRSAASPVKAHVSKDDFGRIRVHLEEPQRALTPGQSAVFYHGDQVLGGGIIQNEPEMQ